MELYKRGSRGVMVRQIQQALGLLADGIFGAITEERVKDFQREHGLKADGIVGPATLARLIPQRLKKSKRRIDEIIVHCTATPEYKHYTAADVRRWHTTPVSKGGRGWSDIGYHYLVLLDGTVETGRDVDTIGAHCTGHNSHSIGVCYVGGMDSANRYAKDTRTELQKDALLQLLISLHRLYPYAKIRGHRDFANKECPSFDATREYSKI